MSAASTEKEIEAFELAADVLRKLKSRGADDAEVFYAESQDFSVTVRLGEIETLEESISRGIGMRIFKNGACALAYTSDFLDRSLDQLADDLFAMAEVSDADPANGLPDPEWLGVYEGKIQVFDESLAGQSAGERIERARQAEAAGFAVDPRINNSDGASWGDSRGRTILVNSRGFAGERRGTYASLSASFAAEEKGVKQTDYWYNTHRFASALESPEAIGRRAGERTIAKLGARKVKSQAAPVVVDPLVARSFARMVFGAASAGAIYRKASFLTDRLGQRIASELFTLVDDPTLPDGVASRAFDGEGVRSAPLVVVDRGVLKQHPADSYSARRLNARSTGHAARGYSSAPATGATNLRLAASSTPAADLIRSVKNGLYINQLFGSGFNSVTGDLSQGAAGYWIENGQLAFPVQEITLAGNLLDLLGKLDGVGDDLDFLQGAAVAPTLLLREAAIGGE